MPIKNISDNSEIARLKLFGDDGLIDPVMVEKRNKFTSLFKSKYSEDSETGKYYLKADDLNSYENLENTFLKNSPLIFDYTKSFWMWDFSSSKWERIDETDLMISFDSIFKFESNSFKSSTKSTIIEALHRSARKFKDKNVKDLSSSWVVFKDCAVNLKTKETKVIDYTYFSTNPIPYNYLNSKCTETPVIDGLFTDWVGEDYVKLLKQVVAYCMLTAYPVHRMFCLLGKGRNGKGTFMKVLIKVVGDHNGVSSDLNDLLTNRFSTAKLYKKTYCLIGETDFSQFERTSILKRLTGEDEIPGEYKNKEPFDFYNYAKIIMATNSLPVTLDKTDGFYSRWVILDFPKQFDESRDVFADIPEVEFENLARYCVDLLSEIVTKREFDKQGTIKDRIDRYEKKSNPLILFIENECVKDVNGEIPVHEFNNAIQPFFEKHGYRVLTKNVVSKLIEDMGYEKKKITRDVNGEVKSWYYICGLSWKDKGIFNEFENKEEAIISSESIKKYTKEEIINLIKDKFASMNYTDEEAYDVIINLKKQGNISERRIGEYYIDQEF